MGAQELNLKSLLDFATSNSAVKLNHIVNTAGHSFSPPPLSQTTPADLHHSAIVRFYGAIMLAKLLASTPDKPNPYLEISAASSVTFTGGSTANKPPPGWSTMAPFAAAKEGLTRALAVGLNR